MPNFMDEIQAVREAALDRVEELVNRITLAKVRRAFANDHLRRLRARLVYCTHPDRGGSNELTQDVNRLFDVLLEKDDRLP